MLVPLAEGDLSPLETFNNSVDQIFPLKESEIVWPPPFQFDGESLVVLARRVYDNREPVRMEVTLRRTNVRRPE
ncbi:hypothetical protein Aca07nite_44930 [Actinoplanes capillaceus]|uniref:UTRA domain-containing protein n=1 Tax=Actinoplanes campanulatus TaxID=113559 RepID=A0ABQ3WLW3_9ACTN|nr:hypothetical protein Aca07nite_44930 [Actinoplanes capillaceus]